MRLPAAPTALAAAALALARVARADTSADAARLGTYYTSIALYRPGAGTNVVSVGVGTPAQTFNLTLSTNVDYIVVADTDCAGCTDSAEEYDYAASSSLTKALSYTFVYPFATRETYHASGLFADELLTDARADGAPRPVVLATSVEVDAAADGAGGQAGALPTGTAGFWGLGVDLSNPAYSILPSAASVGTDGSPANGSSFVVGFDIGNYTDLPGVDAGTLHWGAVPDSAYTGSFNWLKVNTSVGGSWGIGMDSVRIGSTVIDAAAFYGTLDPGFDPIYMPTAAAEQIYAKVSGASRDLVDTTRWNLPCDASISLTVSISGKAYAVDPATLVASRDAYGNTCWGNVVAWQNGSVPEALGEVRLGTSFLSGVYSALYYSPDEMLVGLAGKPGSVNDKDLGPSGGSGHVNGKLAGILIGSLLAALLILILICYSSNRSSFQSVWARAIRRQQRAQLNAVIRAQTLPPPMMPMPIAPFAPPMPMAPRPYPPYAPYTPYHPVAPSAMARAPGFAPATLGAGFVPAPAYDSPVPRDGGPIGTPRGPPPPTAGYVPTGRYVRQTASETTPSVLPLGTGASALVPALDREAAAAMPSPRRDRRAARASAPPPARSVNWGDASAVRRAPSTASTGSGRPARAAAPPPHVDTGRQQRLDDWALRYAGEAGPPGSTHPAPRSSKRRADPGPAAPQHAPRVPPALGGDLGRMPRWKWTRSRYAAVPSAAGDVEADAAEATPTAGSARSGRSGSRKSWFARGQRGRRDETWAGQ